MNKQSPRPDFVNPQEIVGAWRERFDQRGNRDDEAVAGSIVDVVLDNELFDEYYEQDQDIAAVFDIAMNLEWSNGDAGILAMDWKELEERLLVLEERYKK